MKTIVVGAGGGGIASALLAALRGNSVTLIEGHENLGGCASWFERGEFSFDVGATTVSGVTENAPLGELFKLLGERPELQRVDPGITFHLSSGVVLSYYSDFEKWMEELHRVFPHLEHRKFWQKVFAINKEAWGLLEVLNSFPFSKMTDLWEVVKSPQYYHLYPHLLVSTEMMLKFYQLYDPLYLELINGILLISAQADAPQVPFLIGAMGLAYPQETYAPVGGMKGLMNFFEKKCQELEIEIIKENPVQSISGKKLTLKNGPALSCDELIMNVPYWNMMRLFSNPEITRDYLDDKVAWGAFTLYFGVESEQRDVYHQVHLNHPLVKNYFVSFTGMAPHGFQSVTISTHVQAGEWFGLSKEDYKLKKATYEALILNDFKSRFGISGVKFLTSGTPKSFQKYTGRFMGYVGGLPFLYGMNPWKLKGHGTSAKNVYQVGDTTFPGQGLVGVVAGALALNQKITKREL